MQLTRSRVQAEDLVQEAVLKAYRSFASFQPGSNFRAWIARILTNAFFSDQEKAKRLVYDVDLDELPDPAGDTQLSAELEQSVRRLEDIPGDAFSDEVMTALGELPLGMGIAVYLADVEELPYEEIGEILDIPVGTVRSRIYRGRGHLHKHLLDHARRLGLTARKRP
jgi:RNA polymerase sigma-70 factor (ECF subfamily)